MNPNSKATVPKLPSLPRRLVQRHHFLRRIRRASLEDEKDLQALHRLVSPGDTVLDIGASYGLYTRFLSQFAGQEGAVHAFEPVPELHDVLRNNVRRLRLENVAPIHTGLSDRPGRTEMRIPQNSDGSLNHDRATIEAATYVPIAKSFLIDTMTIDQYCEDRNIQRLDFIKCDVEGHELAVIRGGREMIRRHQPKILVEVKDPLDEGEKGSELRRKLEAIGYRAYTYFDEEIHPWQEGDLDVNYIFSA